MITQHELRTAEYLYYLPGIRNGTAAPLRASGGKVPRILNPLRGKNPRQLYSLLRTFAIHRLVLQPAATYDWVPSSHELFVTPIKTGSLGVSVPVFLSDYDPVVDSTEDLLRLFANFLYSHNLQCYTSLDASASCIPRVARIASDKKLWNTSLAGMAVWEVRVYRALYCIYASLDAFAEDWGGTQFDWGTDRWVPEGTKGILKYPRRKRGEILLRV